MRMFAACSTLLLLDSCKEQLPKYEEPQALFRATIDAEYWLSDTEHSLRVYLRITNIFDETLEAVPSLKGEIVLMSARDTTVRKTLTLNSGSLFNRYLVVGQNFRIDPNETVILKATWDFPGNKVITDSGRNLAGDALTAPFFSYVPDPTCPQRQFGLTEDIVLKGYVTVFEGRTPVEAPETMFPFCFVSRFVDVRVCPRVVTVTPCSNFQ